MIRAPMGCVYELTSGMQYARMISERRDDYMSFPKFNVMYIAVALYAVSTGKIVTERYLHSSVIEWIIVSALLYTAVIHWLNRIEAIKKKK